MLNGLKIIHIHKVIFHEFEWVCAWTCQYFLIGVGPTNNTTNKRGWIKGTCNLLAVAKKYYNNIKQTSITTKIKIDDEKIILLLLGTLQGHLLCQLVSCSKRRINLFKWIKSQSFNEDLEKKNGKKKEENIFLNQPLVTELYINYQEADTNDYTTGGTNLGEVKKIK